MKSVSQILISALIAFLLAGVASANSNRKFLVRISRADYRAHYSEIRKASLDIAGMNIQKGTVDLLVTNDEIDMLRGMGVHPPQALFDVSSDAPDSKFKTPEQVAQILSTMAQTYPTLAQVASIGKSLEGRDIWALKITSNVAQNDTSKPAILFNGLHHAREVMATEVPLDIADYLLSRYGKDVQVTKWLDTNVVYVLPMVNPDGNNMVWTQDNMWRKNTRGNFGVDINRNYPFQWNTCNGSSSDEGAQDYRGPSAASEPETNVIMNFVKNIHPVFDISFHSYSELVIYPYGCGQHTETADVIEPLGAAMAAAIPSDSGSGHYTAGLATELLYPVDGDDIDWMYHEEHVIPYVIELNSDAQGFQPSFDAWRDKTVTKLRPAWMMLLDRMNHSSVRGIARMSQAQYLAAQHSARLRPYVQVQAVGSSANFAGSYPIHSDGTFHLVLRPGDYRLIFRISGAEPLTKMVHVANDRVNLRVDLSSL